MIEEAGVESEESEPIRVTRETGLKVGSAILVFGSLSIIVSRIFFIGIYYSIYMYILVMVLSIFILVTSIYNHYKREFAIFGYVFCLTGSILMISVSLYFVSIDPYTSFLAIGNIKPIIVASIAIIGLVINQRGYKSGSQLCMAIGTIDLMISLIVPIISFTGIYGVFITVFWIIPFDPLLIIIGGAFLYYEHLND
jgi:hypothetical protein